MSTTGGTTTDSEYTDDDIESDDSGEESVKSSDMAKDGRCARQYRYREIVAPYSRTATVSARSATLVVERTVHGDGGTSEEVARIRYITPDDYLSLYGKSGPFSHLAQAVKGVMMDLEDNEGKVVDEDYVTMIIDSENRAGKPFSLEVDDGDSSFYTGVIPVNDEVVLTARGHIGQL